MKKVLFVNDDPIQLFLFKNNFKEEILNKFGASLIVANCAEVAMELINQDVDEEIFLAIVDVIMPHIHGIQLSKMVYEARSDVYIILNSSIGIDEEIENAFEKIPTIRGCIVLPHVVKDVMKHLELSLKAT